MEEKERIVNILNQWDNEKYSTTPSSQVINKEAVPHIKEWCSNSSGKDLVSVKKFLQHLTNEQEKTTEKEYQETPRLGTSSGRQTSRNPISNRPGLAKRDTITNGTFYPDPFEGRGNSTGMFNIVRSVPQPKMDKRPKTSGNIAPTGRKPSSIQRNATQPVMKNRSSEYFEIPTNRSGMFGEVIRPSSTVYKKHQQPSHLQKEKTTQNRPISKRPSTRGQWSRPGTMQSGRSRIPLSAMQRAKTHANIQKQESADKMKYSANMQNTRDEDFQMKENQPDDPSRISPQYDEALMPRYPNYTQQKIVGELDRYEIDVSRNSPQFESQQTYYGGNEGDSSHRPIFYPNKFPGRRYQPSQIFF